MAVSKRTEIQTAMAEYMSENGLFDFMGETGQSANKRYRYILFGVRRVLDGEVKIFSGRFIQIAYTTAYQHLPRRDSRVFVSVEDAIKFLGLAFIQKSDEALAVPVKPPSR